MIHSERHDTELASLWALPLRNIGDKSRILKMSFVKKHMAESFARGLPVNEIIEQVSTLKRLRGNTCVDHGYRERLERYVRSEIERLKRKTQS
jgi:hypothetical protein